MKSGQHQILAVQGATAPVADELAMTQAEPDRHRHRNHRPDGSTITLQAGKKYYMLLVHHDRSWCGGDWFAAPQPTPKTIRGRRARLTGSVLSGLPRPSGRERHVHDTAPARRSGEKSATLQAAAAVALQFDRPSMAVRTRRPTWTDIGATSASTTPVLTLADDGKQFRWSAPSGFCRRRGHADGGHESLPVPTAAASEQHRNMVDASLVHKLSTTSAGVQANYTLSKERSKLHRYPKSGALLKVSDWTHDSPVTVKNVADLLGIRSLRRCRATVRPSSNGVVWRERTGLAICRAGLDDGLTLLDGIAEWPPHTRRPSK
jgi:hypothetical protein